MSMFEGLKNDGLEETEDRLGGFSVRDTDIHKATIKAAYGGVSKKGAKNVTLLLTLSDGDYSETIYVTNKEGENWFLNKNDNSKKVPLPGFTTIEDICLMTTGKTLAEQDIEEKVMKIYNYEEKKELPTNVPVLVELSGTEIYVAIVKQTVDKNTLNESTGLYVATGETKDENVIDKVFHYPSKITVPEQRKFVEQVAEAEARGEDVSKKEVQPVFHDKWLEKNKGVARNKAKGGNTGGGNSGRPGGAPQTGAGAGAKKTTSLFGKT